MYKFFIWTLILAGFVSIAAGLYFYSDTDNAGLSIDVDLPENILVGVPFGVKIGVSNNGSTILNDIQLTLALPEGLSFVGKAPNKNTDTKSFGKIGKGSLVQDEFKLIASSGEQSVRQLVATASYLPTGVSSRFDKKKEFDIVLGDSGMAMDLRAPEQALGGEDFAFEVSYKNVSGEDYDSLQIKMDYPPAFEFKKASLPPDLGKNVWRLGGLRKGSEMKFSVSGNLMGSESSEHKINAVLQAEIAGELYDVAKKEAIVRLSPSPLILNIRANNNLDYVAAPRDEVSYIVTYTNNSDQGFRDGVIKVDLKGEMFDLGSVRSAGIINPGGIAIIWNSATNPELSVIPPRSSGAVSFTIKVLPNYPIRRLSDKNFILKADARIESPTVLSSMQNKSTIGIARLETRVRGNATIDTKVLFRDADSGIINHGPIPPRLGQGTNYTVHWVIKNYSTDISNVVVSGNLAPGVRLTGVSKNNSNGSFSYNESSGLIGWSFEKINATKGIADKPNEVIFQIEAVPSQNFVKSFMPLISETILTAKDDFTGFDIRASDVAITTEIPDDATIGSQGGIVVQ